MESTKKCPYCGKEILAEAKKCRYCGKFFEKKCPVCGEWIDVDAKKCRHCGSWLSESARRMYGEVSVKPEKKTDTYESVQDWKTRILLWFELGGTVGLLWYIYDWAWWVAVLTYLAGSILVSMRITRIIFCFGISAVLGMIAMVFCPALFDDVPLEAYEYLPESAYWDYWWAGVIVFFVALGWHFPAFKADFES